MIEMNLTNFIIIYNQKFIIYNAHYVNIDSSNKIVVFHEKSFERSIKFSTNE